LALLLCVAAGCAGIPTPTFLAGEREGALEELVDPNPDIESRDLFYGPGGRALAPDRTRPFHFVREDRSGTQPKMEVRDERGRVWDVKFGREARVEVVASRIVWAVGFHQPPTYLLEDWMLEGGEKPGPQPAARFRPRLPDWQTEDNWSWDENPFVGRQELRGLLALMILLNNWDIKTAQNVVYARNGVPSRLYVVRDLGASLGYTGWVSNSKDDIEGFEREGFIREVRDGRVEFFFHGAWREPWLANSVRVSDLEWVSRRLARLRDRQWHAAFRAGGYEDDVADRFISRLREKVQVGLRLGGEPTG
jgi:hypothetical protein